MKRHTSTRRFFPLPTFGGVLFIALSLGIFLGGNFLLKDGAPWIIPTGEYIIDTGTIPTYDIFSYIHPNPPWVVYQWGFDVLIGGAYKIAGFHGVVWVCSIIIATTLLLFFKLLRQMGTSIPVAFSLVLLAFPVTAYEWNVRPAIVSHLLFIATLFTLQEHKLTKDIRVLYRLPLIFLIWANTHLGFVFGLVAIGFTVLERYLCLVSEKDDVSRTRERRTIVLLASFLVISLLVTLLNPNSYRLIPFFFRVMSLEQNDYIGEAKSPNFHSSLFLPYELILIILIVSLTFLQRKAELGMLFMSFGFLIASLHALRLSPYFAFLSCIVIAQQLNPSLVPDPRSTQSWQRVIEKLCGLSLKYDEMEKKFGSRVLPLAVVTVVTLLVVSGYTKRVVDLGFSKELFPVEACNFVKRHELPGNLFSSDYWGSYAIFSLYPRYKVFIDGRDVHGDKVFFEMLACHLVRRAYSAEPPEDPNTIFDKYQVNWILINKKEPLTIFLKKDESWSEIYSDKVAKIFLRNNEANRAWLQENLGASPAFSSHEKIDTLE